MVVKISTAEVITTYDDMPRKRRTKAEIEFDSLLDIPAFLRRKAPKKGEEVSEEKREWVMPEAKVADVEESVNDEIVPPKKKERKPRETNVQDHMRVKLNEHIAQFEEWEDRVVEGSKLPNVGQWLKEVDLPQVYCDGIREFYEPRVAEFEAAKSGDDPELKAAYAHLKSSLPRILEFYEVAFTALAKHKVNKQMARATPTRKPPTPEKIAAKVVYLEKDTNFNLTSVAPAELVGAEEIWLFNVKTRKLARYVADPLLKQMTVKGSTIIGYDEKASFEKTIRKPKEQLATFKKSDRAKGKEVFEAIRAVECKLTGRINKHHVIIRTFSS